MSASNLKAANPKTMYFSRVDTKITQNICHLTVGNMANIFPKMPVCA